MHSKSQRRLFREFHSGEQGHSQDEELGKEDAGERHNETSGGGGDRMGAVFQMWPRLLL